MTTPTEHPVSCRMTHQRFAEELTRFAQACSRGDAGQALASRSALLMHDKEVQADLDRCAADTTAADLAQEIEFLKAEARGPWSRRIDQANPCTCFDRDCPRHGDVSL